MKNTQQRSHHEAPLEVKKMIKSDELGKVDFKLFSIE